MKGTGFGVCEVAGGGVHEAAAGSVVARSSLASRQSAISDWRR